MMRILVAIDGSEPSKEAIRQVTSRPWPEGSEIKVVLVELPVDKGLIAAGFQSAFDQMVLNQRSEADKLVRQAVRQIQEESPLFRVYGSILQGVAKQAIVAEADRWRADLVVLGAQGLSALGRLFLGSVSDYVVRNAPCSVQVARCRPQPDETHGQPKSQG